MNRDWVGGSRLQLCDTHQWPVTDTAPLAAWLEANPNKRLDTDTLVSLFKVKPGLVRADGLAAFLEGAFVLLLRLIT